MPLKSQWFTQPVSISPLVSFRILFGLLAIWGTSRFYYNDWLSPLYQEPTFYFRYLGFEWLPILKGEWIHLPFICMLVGALGITLGLFFRFSASIYFLSFTYVELIDKTNYLNHYYLVSLLAFLLIFLPAAKAFSLDVRLGRVRPANEVSRIYIDIIKFQLICVYFFAGLAKLNPDWLFEAEPLYTWLQSHRDTPFIGTLLAQKTTAYLFSWAGCIFDLSVGFLLLFQHTRLYAYVGVVFFHLLTAWLFPIGVFPFVMIALNLIFFSADFHSNIYGKLPNDSHSSIPKPAMILFALHIGIQALVPFRFALYDGPLFWREEGFRFSWRVLLMHKEGLATFYVEDRKTGGSIEVNNEDFLNRRQIEQMSTQPDMILQYAHYLYERFNDSTLYINNRAYKIEDPAIKARVYVSLNGRKSQLFVDSTNNLAQIPIDLSNRNWIEPWEN